MIDSNIGFFYSAPHWTDPDYFGFLLLQRVFGSFNIETDRYIEFMTKTSNEYTKMLSDAKIVLKSECIYSPYVDCGIFGHYIETNSDEASLLGHSFHDQIREKMLGDWITDETVQRAKKKLYAELYQI